MKKRRVLHQACAFSVAVMLVGVNAVPVVAADNAPAAYTNADETWKGKTWAIITVDSEKGTFKDYGSQTTAGYLEESDYTITLPTVIPKEGYTWTGWEITEPNGNVYNLSDEVKTSLGVTPCDGEVKVVATFKKDAPAEKETTTLVTFNNSFDGNATLASGNPADQFTFWNKDSAVYDIPKYNVKDGYEITGWTVTGSETTTWSKDKTTFTLSDVNAAYSDNGEKVEGFATVVPVVSKKEESKKVVVNATVKVDPNKGYFEVYGDKEPYETTNENLQDDGCKLGYLPKVVAKDGYTWTGWKVKDEGGNVVYSNITTDTFELMFDCTKSQNYTVEATFEENKAEEKTVEVYFNIIDSEKGSFPDYAPSTVVSFKGIAADTDQQFEIPAVKANDGYKFTGWKVEGAETQNWDADAKTFGVTGLAHFPEGSNVGYVTITPEFEKVEETPAVAVANAYVVIDSTEGSFEGYEGATQLDNENLQDSKYNLEFLPTVVANEGYTFKGWKVTNKAGEEIYNLDANATSISFPYGVADDYTVTAVLEKNEEEAVANATVVIDSVAGSFEGYEGATELHNENLQEAEYNLGFLPTVVANEGYTFKGWKVTNKAGEEIYNLDANATSISFPYGVADDYTVTAVLEKNEEEVAVANATVVIDSVAGSFEGYEGATELHNENLQEAEYNLGFLPTVVANEGYTFKGWKVTNKAGEEIYNLDANATSISFPYGVADNYTVTAVLEKNETPVDPDQPSVDPSKPSTPEEKPGTSIEENKKDDKTSTTVAKDDKKTNKKKSAKEANEQKSDTVQTGDHSNVFVYVATLLIAGAAAVVAFFRRRNA